MATQAGMPERNMHPSKAITRHRDRILDIAAAHGAGRVRVFGSAVHGHDREGSDLDLLVDLPTGTSLLKVVGLEQALSDTLRIRIDLCTERELHTALRERILAEAQPL